MPEDPSPAPSKSKFGLLLLLTIVAAVAVGAAAAIAVAARLDRVSPLLGIGIGLLPAAIGTQFSAISDAEYVLVVALCPVHVRGRVPSAVIAQPGI